MKKYILCALALAMALTSSNLMAKSKGSLKIAGSNTVLPLSQLWAEEYMSKHEGASISVSGGGTGTGLSMLLNGTCDIANASREAKSSEIKAASSKNSKLVAIKVARDGLAIIINPANNVKNLTIAQLTAIYGGKVESWNEVGGKSKNKIVTIGRDSSSGTYGFVQEKILGGKAFRKDIMSIPTTQAICQAVAQSKDAIGYVGVAYAHEFSKSGKVKIVSISEKKGIRGEIPTRKTVMSGEYPLFRYLYFYTMGNPKGLAGDFVKYALSPEGQKLVEKSGYYPLK